MDEGTQYRVYLAIIAAVADRARLDAKRGDTEAAEFLAELRSGWDIPIPKGRQQSNATQRWGFDETEAARRVRRAKL